MLSYHLDTYTLHLAIRTLVSWFDKKYHLHKSVADVQKLFLEG